MDQTYMKEQPVLKLIVSMALPMVISMMVSSLYNIVDSFFIARISEDAMTALSLVYPVQNLINAVMIGFGIGALFFLGMLIYTLFFALPFEETYCEENKLRAAYTEGVYGLCRHPGVLWFAGAFLCMWGMLGGLRQGIYFGLMIFWNYLYIIFQDLWTFPRTFFNYREYQQSTPFLIPNGKSIRVCMKSIRKRSN